MLVNELGAHGYRWLPRTVFMEKALHPRNYEYRNSPPWFVRFIHGAGTVVARRGGISPRGHHLLLARRRLGEQGDVLRARSGKPAFATQFAPGTEIKVADAMRVGNVMKAHRRVPGRATAISAPSIRTKVGLIMEKRKFAEFSWRRPV
jgi:phosphoenolpyruvate carboxylase